MSLRAIVAVALLLALMLAPAPQARAAGGRASPTTHSAQAPAGELQFPRITGAGGVFALPAGTDMPDTAGIHRVVIDASDDATTATGVNRHLEAAARAVNLYALAGVPPGRAQVAVVVHGKATPLVLSDVSYRKHFDKPHPDMDLIGKLRAAGVELFVCGQALSHRGYRSEEVRDEVLVTLSAMTKLVELQAAGYGLIP